MLRALLFLFEHKALTNFGRRKIDCNFVLRFHWSICAHSAPHQKPFPWPLNNCRNRNMTKYGRGRNDVDKRRRQSVWVKRAHPDAGISASLRWMPDWRGESSRGCCAEHSSAASSPPLACSPFAFNAIRLTSAFNSSIHEHREIKWKRKLFFIIIEILDAVEHLFGRAVARGPKAEDRSRANWIINIVSGRAARAAPARRKLPGAIAFIELFSFYLSIKRHNGAAEVESE